MNNNVQMKDVLLPLSEATLVSAAVSRFGIKLTILQSDTDSDSSYPNPEFIVATSINREDLGTTLRTGDKLVLARASKKVILLEKTFCI